MLDILADMTREQVAPWFLFTMLCLIALGMGYYLNVVLNLLSVTCQMLQTLAFHTNQMSTKLSALVTGDKKGKDLHELIEEEKDILQRIETYINGMGAKQEEGGEAETGTLAELIQLVREMHLDLVELRGIAYNSNAIRRDIDSLTQQVCASEILEQQQEDQDADRKSLDRAIDKIEKSNTRDLGLLTVQQYKALLLENAPIGALEDLEVLDRRVHRFRERFEK